MSLRPERVMARYLNAAIGDPKRLLTDYEGVLRSLTLPAVAVEGARQMLADSLKGEPLPDPIKKNCQEVARRAFAIARVGWNALQGPGHQLFLSLIQTYVMPPALRKKIEIASRLYLKQHKPRLKAVGVAGSIEQIDVYQTFTDTVQGHLDFAREAIAKGKEHAEEGAGATKLRVGSFTLINTGGFSSEVMENVAQVMKKSEALLQTSGFGSVCYGDVHVTNTLHKSNVIAFYLIAQDDLFVRANVKATSDTVHTVLHELGHRFEKKQIKSKRRDVERLYAMIGGQERDRALDLAKEMPPIGEEVVDKGKTYRVTGYRMGRDEIQVLLEMVGVQPKVTGQVSLTGYLSFKGDDARNTDAKPDYKGYVTNYAKNGGPSENFAEMFSFYCMGRLPVLQSVAFEDLCFGGGLPVEKRAFAARFAARQAAVRSIFGDEPGFGSAASQ